MFCMFLCKRLPEVFYRESYSITFIKIYNKTPVSESLFLIYLQA